MTASLPHGRPLRIEMQHVPYRGSAPALNDLIAGRVDVMFDYPVSVGPHVEAAS